MDRYQRVEKPREVAAIGANEIRITAQGRTRNYITYALALLQDNPTEEIVIKAMGRAISKTVAIVELLKKELDTLSPGYQPPIPADQVRPPTDFDQEAEAVPSGRGRGHGRHGRGKGRGFSNEDYDDEHGNSEVPQGYRGWGRGRGRRGSFGPGRGYGGGGYAIEDSGGYDDVDPNAPPVQGHG
ncbi:hypothetical protein ABZP36_003227 [Zizania latifolia]